MLTIGTKWMVVAAGIVSTISSLFGGLLMYTEGLSILEKTVEEVGMADVQAMHSEGTRTFKVVDEYMLKYRDVLTRYNNFTTRDEFAKWAQAHALADLHNGDVLESVVLRGIHKTDPAKSYIEYLWIDPLEDGSRDYIYAALRPEVNTSDCPPPCLVTHSLEPLSGDVIENVYNYTDVSFPQLYLDKAQDMSYGDSFWGSPILWYSKDNTPYVYIEHQMYMPPPGTSEFFKDMTIFTGTDLAAYPFEKLMLQHNTDALMLLTQMDKGHQSFILAANFREGRVEKTCKYDHLVLDADSQPCLKRIMHLTSTQRSVVEHSASIPEWTFTKAKGYWIIKTTVFQPSKHDTLAPVYLVWFRDVSKVKDEMNGALWLFLGFVAGVLVFDIMIGTCEIILVARPLNALAASTVPLQDMRLAEAEEMCHVHSGQAIQVKEVVAMREGLIFAVQSLQEYKSFMPSMLFAKDDDEEELSQVLDSASQSNTQCTTNSSKGSTTAAQTKVLAPATNLGVTPSRICAALVALPDNEKLPKVTDLIGELEDITHAFRGQLHGFFPGSPGTLLITWSGYKRDESACNFLSGISRISAPLAIGFCTGASWKSGNIGTKTYRGFTLEGGLTKQLHRSFCFARYARHLVAESVAITCAPSAEQIRSVATTLTVGKVAEKSNLMTVCELSKVHMVQTDEEWMYNIEEAATNDKLVSFLDGKDPQGTDFTALPEDTALLRSLKEQATAAGSLSPYTIRYLPESYASA